MNSQDIFNGVTDIRDDLIEGAKDAPKKRRWTKHGRLGVVAAVVALAILGGLFLRPGGGPTPGGEPTPGVGPFDYGALAAYAVARAEYPQMAPYPTGQEQSGVDAYDAYKAWEAGVRAQRRDLGDIAPLQNFFARSSQTFLTGTEGENRVYSPLNVYLALGMLAQVTGGESREQILELLGSDTMEALRRQANDVWNANYRDDGTMISVLANSLWLNEDVEFDRDAMDTLAEDFYASSYRGEMGSDGFNRALQSWLNQQTGGLLEEQAGNIELDSDTVLALASTVWFRAVWRSEFSESETARRTFHTPVGDVKADFMRQQANQTYYWGDKFAAVSQDFSQGGRMWFLLPDEGVSPEELLSDGEAVDFLFTAEKSKWENQKFLSVNKSIPKFDVASQFDLAEGLRALGVTDVFDPARADFTPMTTDVNAPISVSKADHAVRVVVDEEGCTAAAFAVIRTFGGVPSPLDEEVDFVLDRPFIFCVTGDSGLPLFVGIVNRPAGS